MDPAVILLINTPPLLADDADVVAALPPAVSKRDELGEHLRAVSAANSCQIALLYGTDCARPLAAIVPLDAKAPERLSSLERYLRSAKGSSVPDKRLTSSQRVRLGHMLRALDGRIEGASHFDIAHALFGPRFIFAEDWQDSPFRYTTLRLIRDGYRMIEGGYRQLLRFRRRDA
ncbi:MULTISPECIES: DUF2285 domain-containing protein [Aminobacter]|uniref:T6SS Transcription factor RovC-like DNA binding domain-containing protein n=1 Tax=Aminobacter ciceronei TaxID=150723 RepID=A0ABR6CF40_9HYPH|nr:MULTISPECIES: DUF2285 domain-containing protein [Aminobacter]MBA8909901.1 hypothetical protein [Aminobacter ciceronei]MBA9023673.1 hypothetical protein [Aminobacter ciceronei]MDR7225460.1 hypothetical protein [Aminobacter aminovorans]